MTRTRGWLAIVVVLALSAGYADWHVRTLSGGLSRVSQLGNEEFASNLRICHRLNLLRAGDNVSHLFEWTVSQGFPAIIPPALSDRLTWIPLTPSCEYAVVHAATFKAPTPIHFYTQLPGPKDLKVQPGE